MTLPDKEVIFPGQSLKRLLFLAVLFWSCSYTVGKIGLRYQVSTSLKQKLTLNFPGGYEKKGKI